MRSAGSEERDSAGRRVTIGLWADPDTPAEIARELARLLPDLLARRVGEDVTWSVEVVVEPFAVTDRDEQRLLRVARKRMEREGWDILICLTDLPLHSDKGRLPLVADVSTSKGIALISLPALGGVRLRRRVREAIVRIVEALAEEWGLVSPRERTKGLLAHRTSAVAKVTPSDEAVDVRYIAIGLRGRLRLLIGMVRANQPWRLVPGLKSALAAALATGAIALVNSNVWLLSDALGAARLTAAMVTAILLMVGWLIVAHDLWARRRRSSRVEVERVVLYNASTVLTLGLGVLTMYAGLFALTLGSAAFLIEGEVFWNQLGHPAQPPDYLDLAWLTSSVALIAGAVGSSLESDEAVRAAAYSRREQERRAKVAAAGATGADSDS
jgi:hypothetical protein